MRGALGTVESVCLLQRACACASTEDLQMSKETQKQRHRLNVVSARVLTRGVADAILQESIEKKTWVALMDPSENSEICEYMLASTASIPQKAGNGFHLFLCERKTFVTKIPGRSNELLFFVEFSSYKTVLGKKSQDQ